MREHPLRFALAFAIVLSFSATASAQTKQSSEASKVPNSDPAHVGVWMLKPAAAAYCRGAVLDV